jgi:heterodisulfide reductase subunit A-like polyferredoxin
MTVQPSGNGTRCGVFLCQCGLKIAPKVDLPALEQMVRDQLAPSWVETLPFPCMAPGLEQVIRPSRTTIWTGSWWPAVNPGSC